ncbi:bis(5'-nucleosyl)-tetraphosphatase PrpE [Bacillus alkalisoli]|uniref:bis(5'-nucleosyl)-tetraphosphatase PrpE n=1 Tax=Bacillus alkalisoli TaxID=2011008 RepID=UPI001D0CE397|nr:bis(5'-nucleosyl)-tetraphosphatase PrpE [Bacillus alkalisoli]
MTKFDIIGDVHGCYDEMIQLIKKLGYGIDGKKAIHPKGRKLTFVGDLTDRGPHSLKVISFVYSLVQHDLAHYVPGNHCNKLYRYLLGNKVQVTHGLETTVAELELLTPHERKNIAEMFIKLYENASLYEVLDSGKLVVCHAGIKKEYIGSASKKVKTFVLYGDITGEFEESGMPVRRDWARHYDGEAWVVYGHTPVKDVRTINKTVNIDTGAVFGGHLSAIRYPEMEVVSVASSMPFVEEKFRSFD